MLKHHAFQIMIVDDRVAVTSALNQENQLVLQAEASFVVPGLAQACHDVSAILWRYIPFINFCAC